MAEDSLPSYEEIIEEIKRVLKQNGIIDSEIDKVLLQFDDIIQNVSDDPRLMEDLASDLVNMELKKHNIKDIGSEAEDFLKDEIKETTLKTDDFFDPKVNKIVSLPDNHIFVFGSNEAGRHGKGAALDAVEYFGAIEGQGVGLQGQSYAIPTKNTDINTLDNKEIQKYVDEFLEFAKQNPDLKFVFTNIGTGLAEKSIDEIAAMVSDRPDNVIISKAFSESLDIPSPELGPQVDTNKIIDKMTADDATQMQIDEFAEKQQSDFEVHSQANVKEGRQLSNFHERPFEYKGIEYRSVEHAYQTLKGGPNTFDEDVYRMFLEADFVDGIGPRITGPKVDKEISEELLETLMRESLEQNPDAMWTLLRTKGQNLTHSVGDKFWSGKFPEILMKIRDDHKGVLHIEEPKGGWLPRTSVNASSADITIDFAPDDRGSGARRSGVIGSTQRETTGAGKEYIWVKTDADGNFLEGSKPLDEVIDDIAKALSEGKQINIAGSGQYSMKLSQEQINNKVYEFFKPAVDKVGIENITGIVRSGGQSGFDMAGVIAFDRLGISTLNYHNPASDKLAVFSDPSKVTGSYGPDVQSITDPDEYYKMFDAGDGKIPSGPGTPSIDDPAFDDFTELEKRTIQQAERLYTDIPGGLKGMLIDTKDKFFRTKSWKAIRPGLMASIWLIDPLGEAIDLGRKIRGKPPLVGNLKTLRWEVMSWIFWQTAGLTKTTAENLHMIFVKALDEHDLIPEQWKENMNIPEDWDAVVDKYKWNLENNYRLANQGYKATSIWWWLEDGLTSRATGLSPINRGLRSMEMNSMLGPKPVFSDYGEERAEEWRNDSELYRNQKKLLNIVLGYDEQIEQNQSSMIGWWLTEYDTNYVQKMFPNYMHDTHINNFRDIEAVKETFSNLEESSGYPSEEWVNLYNMFKEVQRFEQTGEVIPGGSVEWQMNNYKAEQEERYEEYSDRIKKAKRGGGRARFE